MSQGTAIVMTCTWRGCDRTRYRARLCRTHHKRKRRFQDMDAPIREWRKKEHGVCTVIGCATPRKVKGMCRAHYERVKRHGSTEAKKKRRVTHGLYDRETRATCSQSGCNGIVTCKGLCTKCFDMALAAELRQTRELEVSVLTPAVAAWRNTGGWAMEGW